MTNEQFLRVLSLSFEQFVACGTSRSTAKLKPLHGAVAADLADLLGSEYQIFSQGYGNGREAMISGRYVDKAVDITIKSNGVSIAGVDVKFVMQNYSQNSNNYFENMLGETANIRANRCPYFQIFIILDRLPYYKRSGLLTRWESFTDHNASKYLVLSHDDTGLFYHTPDKTLVYVVHIPDNDEIKSRDEYMKYYTDNKPQIELSEHDYSNFGPSVILNDYELFINKVYHAVCAM